MQWQRPISGNKAVPNQPFPFPSCKLLDDLSGYLALPMLYAHNNKEEERVTAAAAMLRFLKPPSFKDDSKWGFDPKTS